MSKRKHVSRDYLYENDKNEGLRQRKLKQESRWKFHPNTVYTLEEDDEFDDIEDDFDTLN